MSNAYNISASSFKKQFSFIIAGGGTGGHIFPAIAIANALRVIQPNCNILFVGAKGKMEMEKVPAAGYSIKGIEIVGFNRSSILKNLRLPLLLIKSFFQVRKIINEYKPDAVIGVGGYSSFPVLRFAQSKNIATFIHESNSYAGKSNILLAKKAKKIFVATAGMNKFFPENKILVTGNPVRKNIANKYFLKEDAVSYFDLSNKFTVFITGGSLGAKSINECLYENIQTLLSNNIQIIWQTGKLNADKYKQQAKFGSVWVNDFITDINIAYAAADVIVSRAGAMAVAELSIIAKPVIFIPFPFAAEDHQTANAAERVNNNAAIMIKDADVNAKLIPQILALKSNEQLRNTLGSNLAKTAVVDADEKIANYIFSYLNK